jgi:type IV pilus assembly protein PilA
MKRQKGFSLIELLIVVAIILIIAAIAIPNLLRSKMSANESSAVSSLRTINTGEVTYAAIYPGVGYSANLASLGGAPAVCAVSTNANSATACIIDNILVTATGIGTAKSGYFFTYNVAPPIGGIYTAYTVTATPANPGATGQRYFYTDQTGVLRYGVNSPADITSSAIQ